MKDSTREMLELYNSGSTLNEISMKFNISRQAVHQRLERVGYTPRPDSRIRSKDNICVVFNRVKFFKSKDGFRTSTKPRRTLNKYIWQHYFGEIPDGCMVYTKLQGSVDIKDYYILNKEQRRELLKKISTAGAYKAYKDGTVKTWKMGEVKKYNGQWMKKERAEWLEKNQKDLDNGIVVYNGVALSRGEASSCIRNRIPKQYTEEGALIFKIKQAIKQRESK